MAQFTTKHSGQTRCPLTSHVLLLGRIYAEDITKASNDITIKQEIFKTIIFHRYHSIIDFINKFSRSTTLSLHLYNTT